MNRLLLALAALLTYMSGLAAAQAVGNPLDELADSSTVVVVGQVEGVSVRTDAGAIYTYATVTTREVLKGTTMGRRVVVKQLGGTLPSLGLYVADQATFVAGEEVLLFLGARPRDGSLYTVGLGRGKWRLSADLSSRVPAVVNGVDRVAFDDNARRAIAASRPHREPFVTVPAEHAADAPSFTLIPPGEGGPARWHDVDEGARIPVDYQSGANVGSLDAAIAAWDGVGTRMQMDRGASGPFVCPARNFTGNGRIAFYWNDPCGEVGDGDAATFGLGGGFFTPGFQKTVNGVVFNEFLQGLAILNNTGPHLASAACLQDATTHVLGHAIGLGHSSVAAAVMYPTLRPGCTSGSTGLAADDVEGLRFIYPAGASGGSAPHAPTAITNSVVVDTVTLSWTPATTGGPAQSYILEAGSAPGQANIAVFTLNSAATSTVITAVPPGVYYVRVRARNVLGTSPASPDTVVTVGPCTAPAAPTALAYRAADGLVTLSWTPPAGNTAQGYVLYAGSAPGLSDALVAPLGPTPGFSATAPFGSYFVRVAARNSCAIGTPSSEIQVVVAPCTGVPNAPTGLAFTRSGSNVTLAWNAPAAGNQPSRFVIEVGSVSGASDLLVVPTTGPATSFGAVAPRGTYFVRVRGRNNCGVSAVSNEVVVQVP